MEGIACDRCGAALLVGSDVRYEVRIEVKAAYDPMEITREDLKRDLRGEMARLIEKMSGMSKEEAEAQVFKSFKFDLCPPCQKLYVRAPLPSLPA